MKDTGAAEGEDEVDQGSDGDADIDGDVTRVDGGEGLAAEYGVENDIAGENGHVEEERDSDTVDAGQVLASVTLANDEDPDIPYPNEYRARTICRRPNFAPKMEKADAAVAPKSPKKTIMRVESRSPRPKPKGATMPVDILETCD